MEVEIRIDSSCSETKVVIVTSEITDEITELAKKLSENTSRVIVGYNNDIMTIIDEDELIRIYAENGKVFAETESETYSLKQRLYEIEEILGGKRFVRISKSEIINLKKVRHFDLSLTGVVCVKMSSGSVTYVSRRYVGAIKKVLGI